MRTDVLALHDFYAAPLGERVRDAIAARIAETWGDAARLRLAGFGYAGPFLDQFEAAKARYIFAPAGQGVIHWPRAGANSAALVSESNWPLPDSSVDRCLIIHGLEEAPNPHRMMREIWRVLKDDGRVIIVASHRRGLWSIIDSTPFAAGRPYLKPQLGRLLESAMFRPVAWSSALHFPPIGSRFLLRAAPSWERAGSRIWPAFSGVLMVEAVKDLLAPTGLAAPHGVRAIRPTIAAPNAVRADASSRVKPKDTSS